MQTLDYPIRVPSDVLEALGEFTGHRWNDSLALEPFICDAIRSFMRPAAAAQTQPASASGAGYQWKQVFLPEGTRLRAYFGGHYYFARVEGEKVKYGEQEMSPSRFANLQGSGNRNAWKAVWICLPGSDEWLLADVCRSARKAAIARLLGASVPAEGLPQQRERRMAPRRAPCAETSAKRAARRHHLTSRRVSSCAQSRHASQRRNEAKRSPPAPCNEPLSRQSAMSLLLRRDDILGAGYYFRGLDEKTWQALAVIASSLDFIAGAWSRLVFIEF